MNEYHRWYDPAAARWISVDPSGFAAGDADLSRYSNNIPTSRVDPSGLLPFVDINSPEVHALQDAMLRWNVAAIDAQMAARQAMAARGIAIQRRAAELQEQERLRREQEMERNVDAANAREQAWRMRQIYEQERILEVERFQGGAIPGRLEEEVELRINIGKLLEWQRNKH